MVLTDHDIDRIRKNGVIGRNGNIVKGNAALLRYLSVGAACMKVIDFNYAKGKKKSHKLSKKRRSA